MFRPLARCVAIGTVCFSASVANALDWQETVLSYRYGEHFSEPFNQRDIAKHVLGLTYANGYRYGTNFINLDYLHSDRTDSPTVAGEPNRESRGREWYLLYRHTLDLGKTFDRSLAAGPIRGIGLTAGFDLNRKDGDGYESRKQMLVAGPTVMLEVPGFLNLSLLALWESNAPMGHRERYDYETHPMLNAVWGIPFSWAGQPLVFKGYANFIDAKGRSEFGARTRPETNLDMQLMWDASAPLGLRRNAVHLGVGYQYWKNKFGNDHTGPAGSGAFARTPTVRAEFHF